MGKPETDIMEAMGRLRAAFLNAGLREPVAIVLHDEDEIRRLADVLYWHHGRLNDITIHGIRVASNVDA